MAGVEGACERQAELTFAMARHAVVDLSLVFKTRPREPGQDRLSPEKLSDLRALLVANGLKLREGEAAEKKLAELRWMYEPYVHALATHFHVSIPSWIAPENRVDNWQASVWERRNISRKEAYNSGRAGGEHF